MSISESKIISESKTILQYSMSELLDYTDTQLILCKIAQPMKKYDYALNLIEYINRLIPSIEARFLELFEKEGYSSDSERCEELISKLNRYL